MYLVLLLPHFQGIILKKRIAILGSTGSIGTQALDVIAKQKEFFELEVITANSNSKLLIEQAIKYQPATVVIADKSKYAEVKEALSSLPVKVFAGAESLEQVVQSDEIDVVLTAMVGYAGLLPAISAIKSKKHIALANKETLVVAGRLITEMARENKVALLPVDSEHSAIFQCLAGEHYNPIEKIYLTASGGPFRGKSKEFLKTVTHEQALKHPNWTMGAKITIDSATMMNKGLEMIEARWLFNLDISQIDVIVHPQSVIHSIVQFEDGSMKAQMGLPDMKLPIQYALAYPQRLKSDFPRFDFLKYPDLTFEKPDKEVFRSLLLAEHAMKKDGSLPCIMNAANEIAVGAFLQKKLEFHHITDLIEQCMEHIHFIENPTLNDLVETDTETRQYAEVLLSKKSNFA